MTIEALQLDRRLHGFRPGVGHERNGSFIERCDFIQLFRQLDPFDVIKVG